MKRMFFIEHPVILGCSLICLSQ